MIKLALLGLFATAMVIVGMYTYVASTLWFSPAPLIYMIENYRATINGREVTFSSNICNTTDEPFILTFVVSYVKAISEGESDFQTVSDLEGSISVEPGCVFGSRKTELPDTVGAGNWYQSSIVRVGGDTFAYVSNIFRVN